ncbi:GGDEF domain-containing protein [Wenzhouxiangella sediminis]|uniref:diguanylate cyclase n=1 Tax=Wenzhouxiangella sediminis TaxID=1792836 RepID=A0A3E1KCW9_9GAMM|nr:GGDEF domain-containing protein [Wenzhouxiangella sediminis]RFF32887.1 GGDEF domain-containing protein [Wenzhouxiangella sediminis]
MTTPNRPPTKLASANHARPPRSAAPRSVAERMKSDLRLAVVTLYAFSSLCIIGAFGLYRFSIGDWLIGLADIVIVTVFCSIALLAWNPRWTRRAANLFAIAATTAGLTNVVALDTSVMWIFGLLVGNFLMADKRVAVTASAVVIACVALDAGNFAGPTDQLTFIAVATMVSLFSLIFSARVDSQHGELTHMAAHDALTGALNRRSLDRDLAALAAANRPALQRHVLVILDVDDFKSLNDSHGHEAGDRILSELAELVESRSRMDDRFYRYGGEEFVLLLPNTGLEQARGLVERLRGVLAGKLAGPDGPVTVSMGLAELLWRESAESWLRRADCALLEAKRAGKDRCKVA